MRIYENNPELIYTIKGSNNLFNDTKKLYLELFEESRINYNNKQTRNDRKINDYFSKIANDNKHDLAVEIIIEIGNMYYWSNKSKEEKYKMVSVFKKQVIDLEKIIPSFKVANAAIHFDESSPHLHIIGVPFKDNYKRGLERQVGKSTIFTKESLTMIQDKMRDHCIISFNKVYNLDYTLKIKEQGRNEDINVLNMKNYTNIKKEKQKYKNELDKLNKKTDKLSNNTNDINNMIDNLKVSKINKDNYIISKTQINEIKDYLELTTSTTSDIKSSNQIDSILNKYKRDLKQHKNEVELLERKVNVRDDEIDKLNNIIENQNNKIDDLEEQVNTLQEIVNNFKKIWKKFLIFLQNKLFSNDKKYEDVIDDLYNKDILNAKDIDIIQNNYKTKDKDDFEL